VLPQLEEMASVLALAVDVPQPKVLCLSGQSKESVLAVSISDTYEDVEKLTLPTEVLQGFPEADGMIDPAFARLPSGGFHLVIDLNTLRDLREAVRRNVALQMRRTLAVDGTAVFLFRNSDDLGARAGRILGLGKSVADQRRPSVEAFRTMLEAAGFAIISERSAGIGMHHLIRSRLSPRTAHAISKLRLPKSLGGWSMFVCGRGSRAMDIVSPAPSAENANPLRHAQIARASEPRKIENPVSATVEKPQEITTRVVSFTRRSPPKTTVEIASPVQAAGGADPSESPKTAGLAPATVGKSHETLSS